jgi:hypothetical protein
VIINFFFPHTLHIISILLFFEKAKWGRLFKNDIITMFNKGSMVSEIQLDIEELKLVLFCFYLRIKQSLVNLMNLLFYFLRVHQWLRQLISINWFLLKNLTYLCWIFLNDKRHVE